MKKIYNYIKKSLINFTFDKVTGYNNIQFTLNTNIMLMCYTISVLQITGFNAGRSNQILRKPAYKKGSPMQKFVGPLT